MRRSSFVPTSLEKTAHHPYLLSSPPNFVPPRPSPSGSSLDAPRQTNFQPALRVLCNTEPGPPGVGLTWFVCHMLRPQQDLVYLARVSSVGKPKPGGEAAQGGRGGGGHYGDMTEAERAREQTMEATQRRLQREATSAEVRAPLRGAGRGADPAIAISRRVLCSAASAISRDASTANPAPSLLR